MKIEITSSETIQPSAPTPDHLRSYRFSFLDQLSPVLYGPLIFFYPKMDGDEPSHFLPRLKQALSETLAKFYPLAGRIKDNFSVDCNDEGVLYMEARSDLPLQEFLKEPRVESLGRFLPRKTTCEEPLTEAIQVTVQVTKFECGGIAIGTCFLHKIVDGASAYNFLNSWAASARSALGHDAKAMVSPDFTTAPSLFPAKDMLASHMTYVRIDAGIVVVMKRFLFDASAVSTIKERARGKNVPNPSRVEALSAFIWKHVVLASHEVNSSGDKTSMFIHSVNFRSRGIPPLPQGSVGNLYSLAPAQCDQIEEYEEPSVLVSKIREAIKKVNADSVKALQTEEGFMKNFKALASNPAFRSAKKYWCTSWLRLGFTEVDFGWGKPIWICPSFDTKTSLHKNQIIFIDEENGGVEVWMVLDQREMDALERDQEFLAFATPRS